MNHKYWCMAHGDTCIANKLDGTEDGLIAGEARELWKRNDMHIMRNQAIADGNERVANGVANGAANGAAKRGCERRIPSDLHYFSVSFPC